MSDKYNAHESLSRIDIDAPINSGIRHELMEGGGEIVISWQVSVALVLFCTGLAGYAYQIFSK